MNTKAGEEYSPEDGPLMEKKKRLKFEYRPALEGLRGLAVFAVILFHASTPGMENGFAGVDVFFVLSGYLITSLLFCEILNTGTMDFIQFYARRARRLLPASLLVLLCSAIVYKMSANPLHVYQNRDSFVAAAFYSANWRLLWASVDYFAPQAASPMQHYWSLSVEEQFYFAWPIVFFFLVRLTGTQRRSKALVGLVFALSMAALARTFYIRQFEPMYAYLGTVERSYQLFAGAVVALVAHHVNFSELGQATGQGLSWVGLIAPLLLGTNMLTAATDIGLFSTICTLMLIVGLEISPNSGVATFLSLDFLRKLGKWSYSIYLWHWPLVVFGDMWGILPVEPVSRTTVLVSSSIGLGLVGFYRIEKPFNAIGILKRPASATGNLFCRGAEPGAPNGSCWNLAMVLCGLMMTTLVGMSCFVILGVPDEVAKMAEITLGNGLDDDTAECNSLLATQNITNAVYLGGDSYAQAWSWAFQHLTGIYPYDFTVEFGHGCPWYYASKMWSPNTGDLTKKCLGVQDKITKAMKTEKYDILVLANIGVTRSLTDKKLNAGEPGWAEVVRDGSIKRLEEWVKYVDQIVILEPYMLPKEDPVPCLASGDKSKNCDQPAEVMAHHDELIDVWRKVADEMEGVTTIDLSKFFCEDGVTCPARVPTTGTQAWNDRLHPSKEMMHWTSSKLVWMLERSCISLTEAKPLC